MTTITDLLPSYKEYMLHERKLARATIWAYSSDLRALERAVAGKDVSAITRADLRAFMRAMSKAGKSASTIRRTIHGFGTFWRWLFVEGHAPEVVTLYIDLPRKNDAVVTWMSADELRAFVGAAGPDVPLRETVAWAALAFTAMRPDELRNLRVSDVKLSEQVLIVRNTKSRRDRALPIDSALLPGLTGLCEGRDGGDYVFGLGARRWQRWRLYIAFDEQLQRAGLAGRGFTPYSIRHGVLTALAEAGVPLHEIMAFAGHKRIETTQKYLHTTRARVFAAAAKHPLSTGG